MRKDQGTRRCGMRKAALSSLLVLLGALAPGGLAAQQACGGTERWPVKVGTDSGADSMNLQPQSITLQDLIHIALPQMPDQGDNDTRLPEETTVYRFKA